MTNIGMEKITLNAAYKLVGAKGQGRALRALIWLFRFILLSLWLCTLFLARQALTSVVLGGVAAFVMRCLICLLLGVESKWLCRRLKGEKISPAVVLADFGIKEFLRAALLCICLRAVALLRCAVFFVPTLLGAALVLHLGFVGVSEKIMLALGVSVLLSVLVALVFCYGSTRGVMMAAVAMPQKPSEAFAIIKAADSRLNEIIPFSLHLLRFGYAKRMLSMLIYAQEACEKQIVNDL